jgi:hypothetical protein
MKLGRKEMKLSEEDWREIIDCIDFVNSHLRLSCKNHKEKTNNKYEFGYLDYLIGLRNKIIDYLWECEHGG